MFNTRNRCKLRRDYRGTVPKSQKSNIVRTEYKKEKGKRIFLQDKKVPVVYVSKHSVDEKSDNVWVDEKDYIVNFLQK